MKFRFLKHFFLWWLTLSVAAAIPLAFIAFGFTAYRSPSTIRDYREIVLLTGFLALWVSPVTGFVAILPAHFSLKMKNRRERGDTGRAASMRCLKCGRELEGSAWTRCPDCESDLPLQFSGAGRRRLAPRRAAAHFIIWWSCLTSLIGVVPLFRGLPRPDFLESLWIMVGVAMSFWWLTVPVAALGAWGSTSLQRRALEVVKSSDCEVCGYDLTGNESGRCPECGEPVPRLPSGRATHEGQSRG